MAMNTSVMQSSTLGWAIVLVISFPLLTIILGEVIHRLKRRGKPLAATLRIVRNLIVPVLVFLLFMQKVLLLDEDGRLIKTVQTLLWVCVIHASLSLLNVVLFEEAEADTWRSKVPKLLIDLSRLLFILAGTAIVLATVWNADLAGLVTALGVSSIVIGLALQDTLGSVTSGIALLFEQPFSVGDWLKVNDFVGRVIDINWRAVRLQTFEQEMLVIPHKVIGGEIIRNFSRPMQIHAERIKLGFSYKHAPNLVKEVLRTTALSTQGILSEPEPQIFTLSYDDSAITYEVKFFIQDYGELEGIRDRFMTRVWYSSQRHGLSIPFPIRTLYHFNGPSTETKQTDRQWNDALQSIPSFVPIDQDPESITQDVLLQRFASGEKVLQQGEMSHALYIIVSGQAQLRLNRQGVEQEVLTLDKGEFFGMITLLSGEPSAVSIVAIGDLDVMRLSSTIVNQMIEHQPNFARELSEALGSRRHSIQSAMEAPQN
jgi:small-conductance mechanosensitive channel